MKNSCRIHNIIDVLLKDRELAEVPTALSLNEPLMLLSMSNHYIYIYSNHL